MAKVDPSLEQEIFHALQAERISDGSSTARRITGEVLKSRAGVADTRDLGTEVPLAGGPYRLHLLW